jgi:thiamine pyrophosphate-dependent acetolactate synthase large subunit-like protein
MIRQWQQEYYNGRLFASDFPVKIDFVKLASAYGLQAHRVFDAESFRKNLETVLADHTAALIECVIDPAESVFTDPSTDLHRIQS